MRARTITVDITRGGDYALADYERQSAIVCSWPWVNKKFEHAIRVTAPLAASCGFPFSEVVARLDRLQERMLSDTIVNLLSANFDLERRMRYAVTSKPRPHEFDWRDAKAVFRRWRRGKPVSKRLMMKAIEEYGQGRYSDY